MTTITQKTEYKSNNVMDVLENFPALGERSSRPSGLGSEMPQTSSAKANKRPKPTKGRVIPFDQLGFTSGYAPPAPRSRFNRPFHKKTSANDQRTRAYEQLQDKDAMATRLVKTRLCWSVKKGVVCPHGKDKCKFAHSLGELNLSPCLFGDRCRFVGWSCSSESYFNSGTKTCSYLHPKETRENCMRRTGVDKIVIVSPEKVSPEKITRLVPTQIVWGPKKPKKPKNAWRPSAAFGAEPWKRKLENSFGVLEETASHQEEEKTDKAASREEEETDKAASPEEEEETDKAASPEEEEELKAEEEDDFGTARFSVPRELAMDTLKVALEEGMTCITIDII